MRRVASSCSRMELKKSFTIAAMSCSLSTGAVLTASNNSSEQTYRHRDNRRATAASAVRRLWAVENGMSNMNSVQITDDNA